MEAAEPIASAGRTREVVLVLDAAGRIRFASRSFSELLGVDASAILGTHVARFVRPDPMTLLERDARTGTATIGVEGERTMDVELRTERAELDGHGIAVVTFDAPIDANGARADESNGRLDAIRALRDSERRSRATFDQASVGFAHVGLDGRFLRVNDRVCALLGYTRRELFELHAVDVTLPSEREEDLAAFRALARGKSDVYLREKQYVRKDGTFVWAQMTATCVRDDDGRPEYFFSVLQDIGDRKRAEEAREHASSLLRATLEATVDGVVATDLEERFVGCNGAFLRMWNISIEKDDEPTRILHSPKFVDVVCYREAYVASLDDLYAHPEVEGFDVLELADGRMIERHSRPQRLGDRIVGRVFSFRDVTDRVCAELALKRVRERTIEAQKMEAIGRLAGGIAHDFNNLLTVISAYSDLLLGKRVSGERADEAVAEIRRASERAASLTSQLLAFGRRQMLSPKPVSLNDALAGLGRTMDRLTGPTIDVVLDLDPRGPVVSADPVQLDQVLLNLVVNARDAMPNGGELRCTTELRRIDAARAIDLSDIAPGMYGVVSIRDTGVGMSPEVLACVFEPFFTTKEPGKGTGLGLATVFGIVRQSGGSIAIESEVGVGTTVNVFLPATETSPSRGFSDAPSAIRAGSETLLVVEDSDAVRRLTRSVLESYGYTVLEANDGRVGLRVFAENASTIDAVITDVVMPEMNGRELAGAIRAISPQIPVLLLSGYNEAIAATESDRLGGHPFLAKPFSPEELARRVRTLLDAKR